MGMDITMVMVNGFQKMVIGVDILMFNTFITGLLSAHAIYRETTRHGGCNVTTGIGIGTRYRHR